MIVSLILLIYGRFDPFLICFLHGLDFGHLSTKLGADLGMFSGVGKCLKSNKRVLRLCQNLNCFAQPSLRYDM